MRRSVRRTIVEMGFIIFLFYANLLMGVYTRSGSGKSNGLLWAIKDVFTVENFVIALIASCLGHFVFSYARKKV